MSRPAEHRIINARKLQRIPFATAPLSFGGELFYLSQEEFEKRFHFVYDESIHFSDSVVPADGNITARFSSPNLPSVQVVQNRFENPLDNLAICYISEEVGYGLFAMEDISADTVLFAYSGEAGLLTKSDPTDVYNFGYSHDKDRQSKNLTYAISAAKKGGLARFMQHLPFDTEKFIANYKIFASHEAAKLGRRLSDEDAERIVEETIGNEYDDPELSWIRFKDEVTRKNLATANVIMKKMVYAGEIILLAITEFGIKKFEQVGLSYSPYFWFGREAIMYPCYFYNDARIIPPHLYKLSPPVGDFKTLRPRAFSSLLTAPQENPVILYNAGIAKQKAGEYHHAKENFLLALKGFLVKGGEFSLSVANCHAALASSYRDLQELKAAIISCQKAIIIFSKLLSNNVGDKHDLIERLDKVAVKLNDCLKKENAKLDELLKRAQANCTPEKFRVALVEYEYMLPILGKNIMHAGLVSAHLGLVYCHEQQQGLKSAYSHAEQAHSLAQEYLRPDDPLTRECQETLDRLKDLVIAPRP